MIGFVLALAATQADAQPSRVTLVVSGDAARSAAFTASLRELVARLELELDVRGAAPDATSPPAGAALAAIDADFTAADECKLTVVDWTGRTVLVRRMARTGSAALQAETAAHVVQSVVEELLAASRWKPPEVDPVPLAAPPLERAPQAPAPVVHVEAPSPFGLDLGAFFGGRLIGGPVTAGGGAAVSGSYTPGRLRYAVTLAADYHAPFDVQTTPWLTLHVQNVVARAAFSLGGELTDGFRLDGSLGAGVELFIVRTESQELIMDRRPPLRPPAAPLVSASLTASFAIASGVHVFAAATVDADLAPPRFVATGGPSPVTPLFDPWRFRPSLVLGFSVAALR